jgi:RNA polymerase sigma-70 factor, ECF subfamily
LCLRLWVRDFGDDLALRGKVGGMEETEAIRRLKRGDISGLEEIVLRYQVQAVRAAYLVCGDRAMAEDIVQEAFLRAYERIEQFDPARPFHPWFLRIVVNDALKAVSRAGRLVSLDGDLPQGSMGTLESIDAALEAKLEALETRVAISEAMSQLPPPQRAAIVLRYYVGLSDEEASTRLDCPPGTVRWRLHAARTRLRQLLPPWVVPLTAKSSAGEAGPAPDAAHLTPNSEKGE